MMFPDLCSRSWDDDLEIDDKMEPAPPPLPPIRIPNSSYDTPPKIYKPSSHSNLQGMERLTRPPVKDISFLSLKSLDMKSDPTCSFGQIGDEFSEEVLHSLPPMNFNNNALKKPPVPPPPPPPNFHCSSTTAKPKTNTSIAKKDVKSQSFENELNEKIQTRGKRMIKGERIGEVPAKHIEENHEETELEKILKIRKLKSDDRPGSPAWEARFRQRDYR